MSGVSPSMHSSRWLQFWPPDAKTRMGSSCMISRIRSKKWQHFSTIVPPVFLLNRFQFPTLFRNGNRCSRIETDTISPVVVESCARRKKVEMAGMNLYSIAVQTMEAEVVKRRSTCTSSRLVQTGFSTSTAL